MGEKGWIFCAEFQLINMDSQLQKMEFNSSSLECRLGLWRCVSCELNMEREQDPLGLLDTKSCLCPPFLDYRK